MMAVVAVFPHLWSLFPGKAPRAARMNCLQTFPDHTLCQTLGEVPTQPYAQGAPGEGQEN